MSTPRIEPGGFTRSFTEVESAELNQLMAGVHALYARIGVRVELCVYERIPPTEETVL